MFGRLIIGTHRISHDDQVYDATQNLQQQKMPSRKNARTDCVNPEKNGLI